MHIASAKIEKAGVTGTDALDLFCGAGGFGQGFKEAGFRVLGVDISEEAGRTFELNNCGRFKKADLSKAMIQGDFDVIVGAHLANRGQQLTQ